MNKADVAQSSMTLLWRSFYRLRIRSEAVPGAGYWLWLVATFLLVLFTPSQVLNGVPFWRLSPTGVGQGMLAASAFLALSLAVAGLVRRPQGTSVASVVIAAGACYGAAYLFLWMRPGLVYGWSDFALAAALGGLLVFGPYLPSSFIRRVMGSGLWLSLAFVILSGTRPAVLGGPERTTIETARHPLAVRTYRSIIDAEPGRGGAVEPFGDGFVLVTGHGEFFRLSWDGDSLRSARLALSLPPDGNETALLSEDRAFVPDTLRRVTDLLIDTRTAPGHLYAAYQHWNVRERCMALRVSRITLEAVASRAVDADWTTVFETVPCLEGFEGFDWIEAGGRLSELGDDLLVTVGDFGLAAAGKPGPQSGSSPFGKVWLIDREGQPQVFTLGHRNPQGLFVDADGNVWLTEHGPMGGDELNLLRRGRNYGYPLVTYGTNPGRYTWSLNPDGRDHGDFEEPVYAFQPWRGISNLIRVESALFTAWKGDLLLASLNGGSLFRVRLRGERAVYVEQIPIGHRVRDLAEGQDGRLVLWTDAGTVMTIARGPSEPDGAAVFSRCRPCHEAPVNQPSHLSLRGIVGQRVAGGDGYPYSDALRRLGGVWTEERLDAFLADPASYAPGSDMRAGQVPDPAERQALLTFLRNHR